MEQEGKRDTNGNFKDKFKQNPFEAGLSVQQILNFALQKKYSRDLLKKVEEKNSPFPRDRRITLDKKESTIGTKIDIKTLEQVRHPISFSFISLDY